VKLAECCRLTQI